MPLQATERSGSKEITGKIKRADLSGMQLMVQSKPSWQANDGINL